MTEIYPQAPARADPSEGSVPKDPPRRPRPRQRIVLLGAHAGILRLFRPDPIRRPTRPGGFSQVELAIAIVVLAVGILGVFASFAFGLQSTRFSGQMGRAIAWNRQLIEMIRVRNLAFTPGLPTSASGLNDPPLAQAGDAQTRFLSLNELNAPPFLNDLPLGTGFRRRIQIRRLSDDPGHHRYRIAEILVTVYWMDGGRLREVTLKALHRQP